jgi:hypothetical protein
MSHAFKRVNLIASLLFDRLEDLRKQVHCGGGYLDLADITDHNTWVRSIRERLADCVRRMPNARLAHEVRELEAAAELALEHAGDALMAAEEMLKTLQTKRLARINASRLARVCA